MSILNIPVSKATERSFTEEIDLSGQVYELAFRFNVRDEKWRLSIDLGNVRLIQSLVLVIGEDLFSESRHIEGLPAGNLIVRDLDELDRDPDGTLFGERVFLLYDDLT